MAYDYMRLNSFDDLRASKVMARVRLNSMTLRPFSICVKCLKGSLDSSAHSTALALWQHEEYHFGLGCLKNVSPLPLMERVTFEYLMRTLDAHEDWGKMFQPDRMNRLAKWIRKCTVDLGSEGSIVADMSQERRSLVKPFTDLCVQEGFYEIAVYVAALVPDWDIIGRIVKLGQRSTENDEYSSRLLLFLKNKAPWHIIGDVIHCHFETDNFSSLLFRPDLFYNHELNSLAKRCDTKGLIKWAAFFYLHAKELVLAENILRLHSCTDIADLMLLTPMCANQVEFAEWLLERCSRQNVLLLQVFVRAVELGHVSILQTLLPLVALQDLHLIADDTAYHIFKSAVTPFSRKDAEKITTLCVRVGLSTHCNIGGADLFHDTLIFKRLKLAKLLWDSGAVSSFGCRQALETKDVRQMMENDSHMERSVQRLSDYIGSKGVRSLQELCRLRVSHLLGCHGNREHGIKQLDITLPTKELVAFEDIL